MKRSSAVAFFSSLLSLGAWADEFERAAATAAQHGREALERSAAAITEGDLRRYVTRLASAEYEGRGTGDQGERMATTYLARFFEGLGLAPAGEDGTFFQEFEFRAGMELQGDNLLSVELDEPLGLVRRFAPGDQYQPLSLSTSGEVEAATVFVGFGVSTENYDSYAGLEAEGKWVIAFRGNPRSQKELARFGPLVAKAKTAKEKGAAGILLVKGTNPAISSELVSPETGVGAREQLLPALTITDRLAGSLLTGESEGAALQALFKSYDSGERVAGFPLPFAIGAKIGIARNTDTGRNVVARLVVGEAPSEEAIVIGGHIDHLGYGNRGGSRAAGEEASEIHYGADDNASGVAALMELAQFFAARKKEGTLALDRDLLFAGWSGEEMGLLGSKHYVEQAKKSAKEGSTLYPSLAAYLNLDMVGRASDGGLSLMGTASSNAWTAILDEVAEVAELEIKRSASPYLPTDTAPFYDAGVPILAAFTGLHDDYHTPRDTVDTVDFPGLDRVTQYLHALVTRLATRPEAPDYMKVDRGRAGNPPPVRIGLRPADFQDGGVEVAEVVEDSPAARAGLREGDVIKSLNGREIKNTESLLNVLRDLEPDKPYEIVVSRNAEKRTLQLTPEKR